MADPRGVEEHPNGVRTRPASAADEESCFELIVALTGREPTPGWSAVFTSHLLGERGAMVVAETDDGIVGCATVSYNLAIRYGGEYCELEELIVDETARGLNLGRILVQRTIDDAKRRGCAEMGLYLIPTTEGNRGFYQKLGFEVMGTEMRQTFTN
ncbi:MAG: GNAT family N-acetyltransferase [Actinomycetia bacterium]|nr:GNAT family N-acetyltransferase [Actinomycetes bacterium]MCP4222713.1 GNAT family N-acetyltransferase [Actinomycetes bacterium]MCP5035107.1 GNAT family N-acetyltransferase [Actinomycetes bacterium]